MYYDLTKAEYQKFEKQFKKTYIGQQFFYARLGVTILGCILWGIAGGIVGYNSVETFQVRLGDFTLFFIGGLCLLESVLWHIEYRKELEKYIIEKNK